MTTVAVARPDSSTIGPPLYADVAHVSFTPYDFRIMFSLLRSPDRESPIPIATPQAVAEIVLPPAAVESLMDLLRVEFDRFVGEFGAPRPSGLVSSGQG